MNAESTYPTPSLVVDAAATRLLADSGQQSPIVSSLPADAATINLSAGTEPEPVSYFARRMADLGITPAINRVMVEHDCFDSPAAMAEQLFREDARGGIEILYVGLYGLKTYLKNGKKELPYRRTRIHPDYCRQGVPKYLTPKGAGIELFIPPLVLDAYASGKPLTTLLVTEGEFKAMKATLHGLPCVGAQGIHNLGEKDAQGNRILNTELEALLRTCQVKNVVLLLDNDCLTVEYDPDKDLHKRPASFYAAVRNFRELTKHLSCDVYFQHLNTDQPHKGIDDLLIAMPGKEKAVVDDLLRVNKASGKYAQTLNLSEAEKGLKALKKYFFIDHVDSFYAEYDTVLSDKKFRYQGYFYQHDGDGLRRLISDEITRYVRVGDEYFEHIQKPNRAGLLVPQLDKRAKVTITDDYGKGAIGHIPKYKAFCLVPSHHDYQQVVAQCYNAYYRLSHQPMPGSVDHSLAMVRHIFKEHYEFGLDYLQLLYTDPAQLLPILLLQSKARNTGKSTFGQWLIDIFQGNATKLGNADLENDFNSTYAEKLVIVVDETTVSKGVTSEAIKRMSTEQGKVFVNAKNRQQYETEWIGKFIFATNTLNTALKIGKGETRYFVRTIESLPGGGDDPDMLDKLREEILAFLHWLTRRTLHHPRAGRMYFDFAAYQTTELAGAIVENITEAEREIRQLVKETFEAFPDLDELQFAPTDIVAELAGNTRFKITPGDARRVLKNEFGFEQDGNTPQTRYTYYSLKIAQTAANVEEAAQKRNGRPYTFTRTMFQAE
jgi:hypothetical protein